MLQFRRCRLRNYDRPPELTEVGTGQYIALAAKAPLWQPGRARCTRTHISARLGANLWDSAPAELERVQAECSMYVFGSFPRRIEKANCLTDL
jgi:hypothetical protein